MNISGLIFGITSASLSAIGFLATSVLGLLAPPGVIETRSQSVPQIRSNKIRDEIAEDAPRLRLVSRTSRNRNSTRSVIMVPTAPAPRLATAAQMHRVAAIVEDATVRSTAVRNLHERTRTQIDAAEHALICLRDELAAIMPTAMPEFRAAA